LDNFNISNTMSLRGTKQSRRHACTLTYKRRDCRAIARNDIVFVNMNRK
jgi:hypothetical protein